MQLYFKIDDTYYELLPGAPVRIADRLDGVESVPCVLVKQMATDFKEELRLVFTEEWWNEHAKPTTDEDMGLVLHYHGRCPNCSETFAVGKWATRGGAATAVRGLGECRDCGEDLHDPQEHSDKALTGKTEFKVIKAYVPRHMQGVMGKDQVL